MNNVLQNKFSDREFTEYVSSYLPDFRATDSRVEARRGFLGVQQIGESPKLDLVVFAVTPEASIHARMEISKQSYALLKTHPRAHAIIAYHTDDHDEWRLSLITTQVTRDKKGVKETVSNPRRYSYVLGPKAKVNTPTKYLITDGVITDIGDLKKRFSLEVVNRPFYTDVATHFDELVTTQDKYLVLPGGANTDINIRKSFVVRLIGRLMFCWFLKHKRSTSGQLIPDEILSSQAVSEHYYHQVIEPLFFEVLNTNIDARDIRSDRFDRVPYLNGGLFNPQEEDYYEFDRGTFSSRFINTLLISDDWFRGFFELLETYNFTIDENTASDQELSVDPEMLGKIFESLLAKKINSETGTSEQNETGSFYTPRQIVEFMVDQSLCEYLNTKTGIDSEKLEALVSYDQGDDSKHPLSNEDKLQVIDAMESLKVLDPACGSGAFPIGVLQKIVYILKQTDPSCKLWLEQKLKNVPDLYRQKIISDAKSNPPEYTIKLDVIKNSIFGVDIQPIAVDVSRLRCFLTLVVESEIDDSKPNRGIEPLPNLDFKFVCANTLVAAPDTSNESIAGTLFSDTFQDRFSIAVDRYFSSFGENKRSANNEIHKLIDGKADEKLKYLSDLVSYHGDKKLEAVRAKTNKKQIDQHTITLNLWSSYKNIFENRPVGFFDPRYFFPSVKEGFDIIIGNPPYIKEYTNRAAFDGVRESKYYQGKMDLWYMFACIGLDFLKEDGIECYIAQNNWVTSSGASIMRNKIIQEAQILSLIDFGNYKIFETAGIQTMVMLFKKKPPTIPYLVDYRRLLGDPLVNSDVSDLLQKNDTSKAEYLNPEVDAAKLLGKKITFSNLASDKVLEKMVSMSNFHLTDKEVANGIHHHHDRINKDRRNILGGSFEIGDGIFLLTNEEKHSLNLSNEELGLIKPAYGTKELSKWYGNPINKEWVIYTDSSFKDEKKIESFPRIKKHLEQFREVITSDNKPYGLHRARDERFFQGEKIVAVRKCAEPTFTYTDFDCYVSATFYVIKTSRVNQKYLTGLLNSKLLAFWLKNRGKMQGNNYQIDKEPLIELPLYVPSLDGQAKVVELVEIMLKDMQSNPESDITEYEVVLDERIMDLYELTDEEKTVVRESMN